MLKELLVKEVKDLVRDPRIWIPFVISALVLPIVGLIMSAGISESVREVSTPVRVLASKLDSGDIVEYVLGNLSRHEMVSRLRVVNVSDFNLLKDIAVDEGFDVIIIVREGFGRNLTMGSRADITVVDVVRSISLTSSLRSTLLIPLINDITAEVLARYHGVNLSVALIKSPTNPAVMSYVVPRDELVLGYQQILTQLGVTSFILPLALMIVTISVLQMAATSTAVENEEKTLEMLLTLPVSRLKILLSKLLGSFTVALVGSTFNIVGFMLYLYIISVAITVPTPEGGLGLTLSPHLLEPLSVIYLLASLVLASLAMAALGTTIGVLSSDVRIATAVSGPVVILVVLPGYYVMLSDTVRLGTLLRYAIYALPFTQPMIIAKEAVAARPDPLTPLWLLVSLLFSLGLAALTSRLLTLDRLLMLQRAISSIRMRRRMGKS